MLASTAAAHALALLGTVPTMKLHKALFWLQTAHLQLHGSPAFADDIVATRGGPVVPSVKAIHDEFTNLILEPDDACKLASDGTPLPPDMMRICMQICSYMRPFKGSELTMQVMRDPAWNLARGDIAPTDQTSPTIPHDVLEMFALPMHIAR